MRLAIIPALILLASAAAAATADPAPAASACCAAPSAASATAAERPWYIGPKGGDVRKGHNGTVDASAAATTPVATAAAERPWYIGPKGGDVRKGSNAALAQDAVTVDAAPAHCSRFVAPAVGPKGGILVSKGQSPASVLTAAEAACQSLCNR